MLYQYPAAGAPEFIETHRPLLESGVGSNKTFVRLSTMICYLGETFSMAIHKYLGQFIHSDWPGGDHVAMFKRVI